uniref:Selenoprotein H n=1 Tax=Myripristis murdjan TaxID=586833 RepID=A0A667YAT7_9TELE
MCRSGRRGVKRRAEEAAEERVEERVEVEKKKERGGEEDGVAGQRVLIEHWNHAERVKAALLAVHPDLTVLLNPEKPRKKSFDITLVDGGKETTLWTGITRGPPARLKFPESDIVVAALESALEAE